jgi:uncharacterized protein YdhG (YjbR/CyaY superfamily)
MGGSLQADAMREEVEKYIHGFDAGVSARLLQVYAIMANELKEVDCVMNYGIPTFKADKNIIHFGAFKKHIGVYPGPAILMMHADETQGYATTKGAIQFSHADPLPKSVIKKLTVSALKQYQARMLKNKKGKSV